MIIGGIIFAISC